ncbi:MAG: PadR family transcriptional regulator [Candidatus Dormibacterales bacterium]
MPNRSRESGDAVALTVLALTSERPRHPYDIQREIRERHKEFAAGRPRALYRAVERLEQDGLIEPLETSREGRRPERTVYRVTEEGREELESWLSEMLERVEPEHPAFAVALSFAAYLPVETVLERLQARSVQLVGQVAGAQAALGSLRDEVRLPAAVLIDGELMLALRRAELDWTREMIEALRSRRVWWSVEELARQFQDMREREAT